MEKCPNCDAILKKGAFKSVELLSESQINFINDFADNKKEAYCSRCGRDLFEHASSSLNMEVNSLKTFLNNKMEYIPVISIHTPYNWEYQVMGIVTGQTVTGTGVVSEFKSGFTDFFGGQSGSFNKKIADGEIMALAQLRVKALEMFANAVIAVDLDYADVGTGKGMLMVCATGTAVKVTNTDVFEPNTYEHLKKLDSKYKRLNLINKKYKAFLKYQ